MMVMMLQAAICRCSQPLSGFSARCVEDESLLQAIRKANTSSKYMFVVDMRPKASHYLLVVGCNLLIELIVEFILCQCKRKVICLLINGSSSSDVSLV